jgi:hypothetical protein
VQNIGQSTGRLTRLISKLHLFCAAEPVLATRQIQKPPAILLRTLKRNPVQQIPNIRGQVDPGRAKRSLFVCWKARLPICGSRSHTTTSLNAFACERVVFSNSSFPFFQVNLREQVLIRSSWHQTRLLISVNVLRRNPGLAHCVHDLHPDNMIVHRRQHKN